MFDDNDINLKTEYNKATNELGELRQKYSELEQDWKYIKSLLDAEFEKNIQLQKENDYLLKVMFAIKEYVENEDYENVIKAINKVSERIK